MNGITLAALVRGYDEAMAAEGIPAHTRERIANRLVWGHPAGRQPVGAERLEELRPLPADWATVVGTPTAILGTPAERQAWLAAGLTLPAGPATHPLNGKPLEHPNPSPLRRYAAYAPGLACLAHQVAYSGNLPCTGDLACRLCGTAWDDAGLIVHVPQSDADVPAEGWKP